MSDWSLLQEYVENSSEAAFTALVQQHLDLVYSTALRRLGDPHDAEEVAQKACRLKPGTSVAGWLYRSTCLEAMTWWRGVLRRTQREQEAMSMTASPSSDESIWEQIAPYLDEAMLQLSEMDRGALVLRFFQHKSLGEVGEELGLKEDTARMRVNRALEKLRQYFLKKGVVCTQLALGVVISERAVQATPVAVEASILSALAKLIRPTIGLSLGAVVLTFLRRPGLIGKTVVAGVTLLLLFDLATYLLNHVLLPRRFAPLNEIPRTEIIRNQTVTTNRSYTSAVTNAPKLLTLEGIITVSPNREGPNDSPSDAPIVSMATAGAQYQLRFLTIDQIQTIRSGNLYRVKGSVLDETPNWNRDFGQSNFIMMGPPTTPRHYSFQVQNLIQIKIYTEVDRRLLEASAARNYPLIKEMIANGADMDIRSASFKTPLHNLVIRRSMTGWPLGGVPNPNEDPFAGATMLLENRADVNAADDFGWTPLHYAVKASYTNLVALFLECGANAAAQDIQGRTPWYLAAEMGESGPIFQTMRRLRPTEEPDYGLEKPPVIKVIPFNETTYPRARSKNKAAVDFLASPARDTTECRTMLQLLWDHGCPQPSTNSRQARVHWSVTGFWPARNNISSYLLLTMIR
jgi:RNA polymerase sigma factor (sigma-70 family)